MQSNSTSVNRASNSSDNPLQCLKDAIDRATEIVCSGSQYEVDPVSYFQNDCNYETNANNTQKYETALEDLYETKPNDNDQEISVNEKSFGMSFLDDYTTAENSIEMEHEGKIVHDYVNYKVHDATRTKNRTCETIAEVDSNGSQMQNQQSENLQELNRDGETCINGIPSPHKSDVAVVKTVPTESTDLNSFLLRSSNIPRCDCNSYDLNDLRRRSLPASLNLLKITQSPNLRKIHTRKSVSMQIEFNSQVITR